MNDEKTIVIFRKWKDNPHTVIAIFPENPGSSPHLCGSYEHIGQHGDCDPVMLINYKTVPATQEEYAPLERELERIGYNLDIRYRQTQTMRVNRLNNYLEIMEG